MRRFLPFEVNRDGAIHALDHARSLSIDVDLPGVREVIATLGAGAEAVLPSLWRLPDLAVELGREVAARGEPQPAVIPVDSEPVDESRAKRKLRVARDEAIVRTALRELLAFVDVDATAREWSAVASACIERAIRASLSLAEARNGACVTPLGARIPLVVLGMGKLSGEELNLGSDIDLCVFYGTDEGAAGTRTPGQHFARVVTTAAALLSEVTENGFAFRVDLRLRPEGSRGPAAMSLPSALKYYASHGRHWERAVMLRARPVAGELALGEAMLNSLRPFIFGGGEGIVAEVAAMLHRARRELLRDELRDLKLGRGGIREVEFLAQSLQLAWGAAHPHLAVPGTLAALRRMHTLGLLSARDAHALGDAWGLLRRVEHRVQVMTPFASHELPKDPARLGALARSLGYSRAEDLLSALAQSRATVHALFSALTGHSDDRVDPSSPEYHLVASIALPDEELGPLCARVLNVRDHDGAAQSLRRMARRPDQPLADATFAREPEVGVRLLAEVRDAPDPDAALAHLATLFERVQPAAPYASRLVAVPSRARGLVGLLGSSEHLARALLARPSLLDTVAARATPPTVDEVRASVRDALASELRDAPGDTDAALGAIRRAMREVGVSVGVASVSGVLDVRGVTARLTALAEAVVRGCLSLAAQELSARFGSAGDDPLSGVAVFGLGSLGAGELSWGADLDLLFMHAHDQPTRGGTRGSVSLGEYAVRLAQRTLSLLSVPHAEGDGYATDTRLRPAGSQGTLVVSREAFARYHAGAAASWERQALIRARAVAGDMRFALAVTTLTEHIAYERGAPDLPELKRLRARMELELGREDRGALALKHGRGGLVDVEFAVQALQMAHGRDPRVRSPETRAAMEALSACGYLRASEYDALDEPERLLREAILTARLTTLRGGLVPSSTTAITAARAMGYRDRVERSALDGLLADLRRAREDARGAYREVIRRLEST